MAIVKRWNGSAWVDTDIYKNYGGQWFDAGAYLYSGGEWLGEPGEDPEYPDTPNIVMFYMDDAPPTLAKFMSEFRRMQDEGVNFTNHYISTSTCVPSRCGFLSGMYRQNHGVLANEGPNGGYKKWYNLGHEGRSIAYEMHNLGYRTGLFGKYMNGYTAEGVAGVYPPMHIPLGWDEWFVGSSDDDEFNYLLVNSIDGNATLMDTRGDEFWLEDEYLVDVMGQRFNQFVDDAVENHPGQPLFGVLSFYAPHGAPDIDEDVKFPAAPRHRKNSSNRPAYWGAPNFSGGDCGGGPDGTAPNGGCQVVPDPDTLDADNYNQLMTNRLAFHPNVVLSNPKINTYKEWHKDQIRMVQSIDECMITVKAKLEEHGLLENTYVILSSDNGFHYGEHAIFNGKCTCYDYDCRLTFAMEGPGVADPGRECVELIQNIDIFATCMDIAEATDDLPEYIDGRSILPFLTSSDDGDWPEWRRVALFSCESYNDTWEAMVEDKTNAPPWQAMRSKESMYADYMINGSAPPNGRAEYFDMVADPAQMNNIYAAQSGGLKGDLNDYMQAAMTLQGEDLWQQLLLPMPGD